MRLSTSAAHNGWRTEAAMSRRGFITDLVPLRRPPRTSALTARA
jgi:hypothetical protein